MIFTGLDCDIHLVSLIAGTVIKRFTAKTPILSVEFVKSTGNVVFCTQNTVSYHKPIKTLNSSLLISRLGRVNKYYSQRRSTIVTYLKKKTSLSSCSLRCGFNKPLLSQIVTFKPPLSRILTFKTPISQIVTFKPPLF